MRLIEMRPPRIALLLTMFASAVHWVFHRGEPICLFMPWAGTSVGLAGFGLMMWSWLIFKNQNLAVCPLQITAHITSTGPYRFSRNPMYLGMFLMLLGLALIMGTIPFSISAVAFFVIMNAVFCPYEENKLAQAFGNEYAHYQNEVRRWL